MKINHEITTKIKSRFTSDMYFIYICKHRTETIHVMTKTNDNVD